MKSEKELKNKKEIEKILSIINYCQHLKKGNKPNSITDPIKCLEDLFSSLAMLPPSNKDFKISVGLKTPTGDIDVNILKDCGFIFHVLYPLIITEPNQEAIEQYLKISTSFLLAKSVSMELKSQVIDFENKNFIDLLNSSFSRSSVAVDSLVSRMTVCKKAFENDIPDDSKILIENILSTYLTKRLEVFADKGQFLQASAYLDDLLSKSKIENEKRVLIKLIISHNTSFNLKFKDELLELIEDYEKCLTKDEIESLKSEVNFEPGAVEMFGFQMGIGTLSLESIKGKNIETIIKFSIPISCFHETVKMTTPENLLFSFYSFSTFWSDPMFKMMSSWKIANIGWQNYCDGNTEDGAKNTHVELLIDKLFAPDLKLTQVGNEKIDFSEKEATLVGTYYPHKEYIIKKLLEHYDELTKFLNIKKKDIKINLFSNFYVEHRDKSTGSIIHRQLFAITNPDSFSKTSTRFIEKYSSLNLSNPMIDLWDMITKIKIETEKNLKDLVYRYIDSFIKHNIEKHGDYQYFWNSNKPHMETYMQPYIFNHMKMLVFMGIQISRETISSNGQIDFLVTYTNDKNKLLKLCVELKLAHASNSSVERGITHQLPAYMEGEKCKYGIYAVLWFKGNAFDKPKKHSSIKELLKKLDEVNKNKLIDKIIIDCTKPTPPSKLKEIT